MLINEKFTPTQRKIKIMQFGEGNFLRCFVDWIINHMNKSGNNFSSNIVVVQPLPRGMIEGLKKQNGLYTVLLRGLDDHNKPTKINEVVDNLADFINPYEDYNAFLEYAKSTDLEYIISNTTEAGIVLDKNDTNLKVTPNSFPGKLLALLKTRYDYFNGDINKGLDIIPCELIDHNGDELKRVLKELAKINQFSADFINWIENANRFYNTLVDRIVPGYPKDEVEELQKELGYVDNFMVKGEFFHLWVIEDHYNLKDKFPAYKTNNVLFVDDVMPYKERKVKILNGSHTLMVPVSYLAFNNTVLETMQDEQINSFVRGYMEYETIPTINLPKDDMQKFANDVIKRFMNPYVHHELLSISLNSIFKFKTRLFDTLINNLNKDYLPKNIIYSFVSLIVFYKGLRNTEIIPLNDNQEFLDFFKNLWDRFDNQEITEEDLIKEVLRMNHWEKDLSTNKDVVNFMTRSLKNILSDGIKNEIFLKELHYIN